MSAPSLSAADAFGATELHAAFTGAFSDYVAGPFQLALAQWPALQARQGIDLALSRVAVRDGAIAAFAFACPRPGRGRWRLGAMGALPSARGSGAAPALLDDFLARARAQGLAWAELECFAENERALRLYRGRGFEVVDALDGWKASDAPAAAPARDVCAVDRAAAFAWLEDADRRVAWLPFPNTAQSLAGQSRPLTFWQCDDALLAFSVVAGTPTQIHGLVDHDPALHGAVALAQALRAAHPDSFAPPILRGDLGGAALERAGYVRHGLSQVLMNRKF
jgi:ribosomal protein S18 acetylase RimI-like enzyme